MIDRITQHADIPARILMGSIFALAGTGKIGAYSATQQYMESFGLPGILLAPTIAFEISAGILIILGLATRHIALLLAGFSVISACVFHTDFSDKAQLVMFLKNIAIAGGFLLLAKHGAPNFSMDKIIISIKTKTSI